MYLLAIVVLLSNCVYGTKIIRQKTSLLKSEEPRLPNESKLLKITGGKDIGPITSERVLLTSVALQAAGFLYYLSTNGNFVIKNFVLGRSATSAELLFIRFFILGMNFLGLTLWRLKDKIGTSEALRIEALSHFVRLPFIAVKYIKGGFFPSHLPLLIHILFPAILYFFST